MPRKIHTEIQIAATPQRVWEVLTEFAAYPQWAPFFKAIEGELEPGKRLRVSFQKGPTMRPVVTEAKPGEVLEWHGKLLFGGIFDGRHRFELRDVGGTTRFIHNEEFSGILIPLFGKLIAKTEQNFQAFNQAIRNRAEGATP